jgi:hypothetical protein
MIIHVLSTIHSNNTVIDVTLRLGLWSCRINYNISTHTQPYRMDGQTHQLIRVELGNLNWFLQVKGYFLTGQKGQMILDISLIADKAPIIIIVSLQC